MSLTYAEIRILCCASALALLSACGDDDESDGGTGETGTATESDGSSGGDDGGSGTGGGGSGDGDTGDGDSGDGGPDTECPPEPPGTGGACALQGDETCEYEDACCGCYWCFGSTWGCAMLGQNDEACPGDPPPGGPCDVLGLMCQYCVDGEPQIWDCGNPNWALRSFECGGSAALAVVFAVR
jgi:hypothetical protein